MAASPRRVEPTTPLDQMGVLVVDCQTTGASPSRGHVIELAWCATRGTARHATGEVEARLAALPPGATLPRRVAALTGIERSELRGAAPLADAWAALVGEARRLAALDDGTVPAVAHFARFERSFLEAAHAEHGGDAPFPLTFLCTHELARRLLPDLPRLGLRALAGYFGSVMGGRTKRAGPHVEATAVVWASLVALLRCELDVTTLGELIELQAGALPPRSPRRAYLVDRRARLSLPDQPGVYRMVARDGTVLYVGKATSLQRRVNSYFQKRRGATERTLEMLTQAERVEVTEAATPLEAALHEADEIKRLAPPYNTALLRHGPRSWFASAELASAREGPDEGHRLGPFPSRESLAPLTALVGLVAAPEDASPIGIVRALGLSEGTSVDAACCADGLERFVARHGLRAVSRGALAPLLAVGGRLWRLAKAREPDDDEGRGPRDWDAARVEATLEAVTLRGAQLFRRAHLFVELVDATVAFDGDEGKPGRLLVLDGALVVSAADRVDGAPLPAPPTVERSALDRLEALDTAAYDRLRVLTTELRRVLGSGGHVSIRLDARRVLGPRAVERRLSLV